MIYIDLMMESESPTRIKSIQEARSSENAIMDITRYACNGLAIIPLQKNRGGIVGKGIQRRVTSHICSPCALSYIPLFTGGHHSQHC